MHNVQIGEFVYLNIFVRFLVLLLELLTILYFTVVNSDLGLGRLAEKQRSVALQNMPFTLTCSD